MPKQQIALLAGAIALLLSFFLTEYIRRSPINEAADSLNQTLQEYERTKCKHPEIKTDLKYDKGCNMTKPASK